MKFASLFSGIGGFDLGFEQAGLECAWQCEIDKAARSVLARHWPGVPCYEDIRDVGRRNAPAVDLICGGFPCQDLSVAGKRAGLAGERSGLYWQMRRIVRELKPQWVVIENVPGLLSSNGGNDFAVVVRGLVECGYGVCWRVLDAQYFGVAQRRRRVFIVGSLGDGRAAEVLFERDGLFGHPPARGAPGQSVAGTLGAQPPSRRNGGSDPVADHFVADTLTAPGTEGGRRDKMIVNQPQTFDWQAGVTSGKDRVEIMDPPGRTRSLSASRSLAIYNIQHNDGGQHRRKDRPEGGLYVTETDLALTVGTTDLTAIAYGGNNTSGAIDIAAAVNAKGGSGRMDFESETFVFEPRYARDGRGAPDTIAPPLKAQNGGTGKDDGAPVVAWHGAQVTSPANRGGVYEEMTPTLNGDSRIMAGVRRLTPTECERLQGFPDGHTDGQSDSARYRQLGNAVCVNVARWIGEKIVETAQ